MLTDENGFTFVEIVIVLVILGILVAVVSSYFSSIQEQVNIAACKSNQMSLEQAQKLHYTYYYINKSEGKYAEELDSLIPFIRQGSIPNCPSQGSYLLLANGAITCSIGTHKR